LGLFLSLLREFVEFGVAHPQAPRVSLISSRLSESIAMIRTTVSDTDFDKQDLTALVCLPVYLPSAL
jgi:hypothetical protein